MTHSVVRIFPEVEGDELEGVEHRPPEVIKIAVAEVWVVPNVRQTCVVFRTPPRETHNLNVFVEFI
jgi:hypothetical protein